MGKHVDMLMSLCYHAQRYLHALGIAWLATFMLHSLIYENKQPYKPVSQCGREWRSHRLIHAAAVQRKVLVEAWKGGSRWMTGPGTDKLHSHLVSQVQDGVIWLFNAGAKGS